jgi:EAL domain-containing protein (putative c-di-GMP-specific phosphodiesterase class I)
MSERAIIPHFQPITDSTGEKTIAFEVLGRSRLFGLQHPREMFDVATQLNMEVELSCMMRDVGVEIGNSIYENPHLFVNTHPSELADTPALLQSITELRHRNPHQQITLEIHEAAVTDTTAMKRLNSALGDLNVGLAYDDFGAGQARLGEIVDVSPDYLKFDMSLIQGIHKAPTQRKLLLKRLVDMVGELGIVSLAEGIECAEDRDTCQELGFELFQGYLFGRPATANTFVF